MYGASLDVWANGGSVDFFFTHGEYDFSSLGSCPILGNWYGIYNI